MAAATPFSNPLDKGIFQKSKGSVFFVNFVPKGKDAEKMIKQMLDRLKTVPEKKREERSYEDRCCTGFVVAENSHELNIICSAHCLDHLFTSKKPISAQKIDDLYHIHILCDHYESSFRQDKTVGKKRFYSSASIVEIDCQKDTVLLHTSKRNVLGLNGRPCRHPHHALVPSERNMEPTDKVLMVSWPPYRPSTVATGEVSHCAWEYGDTSKTNPIGYNMELVEVHIPSESGGSGAPLLDADANFAGLLHGGVDSCSWFVSLSDICQALTSWGILPK